MEDLSSHVTMKCTAISSASIDYSYPITVYAANSSYTRASEDQRRRYVRGVADWRHVVTSSFRDYGKYRLTI